MAPKILPITKSRAVVRLALGLLAATAIIFLVGAYTGHGNALSSSSFKAGNIIDEAVFEDGSAMSVSQIQTFLASKVPSCDTNGTVSKSYYYNSSTGRVNDSADTWVTTTRAVYGQRYDTYYKTSIAAAPYVCLTAYKENPSTHANNLQNPDKSVSGAISAAQIIYNAAQEYNISPKVIIVTLQKEQGLVADDWPWTSEYQAAMGYACPDGGSCSSAYYGFANQVTNAAKQFRRYITNPDDYDYVVGSNKILYHYPQCLDANNDALDCSNVSKTHGAVNCGTESVDIVDQATADLYDYTPYVPDKAALSGMSDTSPGGEDRCGSYGNRNFFWYFNTWFGSSYTNTPYAYSLESVNTYLDSGVTERITKPAVSVAPGSTFYVKVEAENMGNQTWDNTNTKIGTLDPQDRVSAFADGTWLSTRRPAAETEESVEPAATATFTFPMDAPTTPGVYNESFGLVQEGQAWMKGPEINLTIYVTNGTPLTDSRYELTENQSLDAGSKLLSQDGHALLRFETSGNLILTNDFGYSWQTNTGNTRATKLWMQNDGNLVLKDASGNAVWSSGTHGNPGAYLTLQTDGNLVLYSASDTALWSTHTWGRPRGDSYVTPIAYPNGRLYRGQTLLTPDHKYKLAMQDDGNLVLYATHGALWSTHTWGTDADYVVMQSDGNLVLKDDNGKVYWSSHTGGDGSSKLYMQEDGNLVIYSTKTGKALWATGTENQA